MASKTKKGRVKKIGKVGKKCYCECDLSRPHYEDDHSISANMQDYDIDTLIFMRESLMDLIEKDKRESFKTALRNLLEVERELTLREY